ncbi:FAD-binding protein [Sinorhizobium sp. BJ1]|uniref:FAD-binding protein n=1 Tax=Sinorhizobium sp. BJ1 TaxID=2035455 RepID=UPI000BE95A91|nr:FAD-binding protein [Sinorhizobium sp. BJ1]PDT83571.1 FAD-binding protein [Sinorhizobium sp. BJ1]
MAGLLAAAAASQAGKTVRIIERDVLDGLPLPRKGVSQGHQPHVLLYRGLCAIEELLPGFRSELVQAGGVPLDTGNLAWLGEQGWAPIGNPAFELVSATRPVVEELVRLRVAALAGVALTDGVRIAALERDSERHGWIARKADGSVLSAPLVIDASGRASRLPFWLVESGFGGVEVTTVDVGFGYASRMYRAPADHLAPAAGILVLPTPSSPMGGVALPVEGGRWMIGAVGAGECCPPRETEGFLPFLERLRDPALADFARSATAVSDVVIHRRTDNVRRQYDRMSAWPAGLLAIGDSFCAFNPVYGQGITVSACQALMLRDSFRAGEVIGAEHRLMRRLGQLAQLPWEIATGEDLRYSSSRGESTPLQALFGKWSRQLDLLAAHGDLQAQRALDRVYHLVGSPVGLLHPRLFWSALKAWAFGLPPRLPRPLERPR